MQGPPATFCERIPFRYLKLIATSGLYYQRSNLIIKLRSQRPLKLRSRCENSHSRSWLSGPAANAKGDVVTRTRTTRSVAVSLWRRKTLATSRVNTSHTAAFHGGWATKSRKGIEIYFEVWRDSPAFTPYSRLLCDVRSEHRALSATQAQRRRGAKETLPTCGMDHCHSAVSYSLRVPEYVEYALSVRSPP